MTDSLGNICNPATQAASQCLGMLQLLIPDASEGIPLGVGQPHVEIQGAPLFVRNKMQLLGPFASPLSRLVQTHSLPAPPVTRPRRLCVYRGATCQRPR